MIIEYCKQNLTQLKTPLMSMSDEQYAQPLIAFSGASIGQHVRHIVEFYICLLNGLPHKKISYDKRERNLQLETDIRFAIFTIDKVRSNLLENIKDFQIVVESIISPIDDFSIAIQSTFYRELLYNLEHSIHHQALIRIGLMELGLQSLIDEEFGIAPSTIRHKNQIISQ